MNGIICDPPWYYDGDYYVWEFSTRGIPPPRPPFDLERDDRQAHRALTTHARHLHPLERQSLRWAQSARDRAEGRATGAEFFRTLHELKKIPPIDGVRIIALKK